MTVSKRAGSLGIGLTIDDHLNLFDADNLSQLLEVISEVAHSCGVNHFTVSVGLQARLTIASSA